MSMSPRCLNQIRQSSRTSQRQRRPITAIGKKSSTQRRSLIRARWSSSTSPGPELVRMSRSQASSPSPPLPQKSIAQPRSLSPITSLKVKHIIVESSKTVIGMVPVSLETNHEIDNSDSGSKNEKKDDIIYPENITDLYPYTIVARYRKALDETTNFRLKPILVGKDWPETFILGIEIFVQQHSCHLNFIGENIHLLTTDLVVTANFQFEIDLDYDNDITQSKENKAQFVLDFCKSVSKVLSCANHNVRVFSIDKMAKNLKASDINFGLITPDRQTAEQLVLMIYRYRFHKTPGLPDVLKRGSYPYYLSLGWYHHAFKLLDKYEGSKAWLGCVNAEREWPVAFHGTH
ncbi:unnamed protein product [Rotaria socialis]|uniref:Uncharacterized protein n=1 Tax=Rotaria socialis TaxID=392032 RepID=A0A820VYW1_9BILA|nr:unnamed protein product [Rotaria socialis]CAF4509357.1 unnamed protein product [Rotaria socialis]